jgi:micrococcal nuclease
MKRFRRSHRPEWIAVLVVLLLAALRWWSGDFAERPQLPDRRPPGAPSTSAPADAEAPAGLAPGEYEVERVVDGDTLLLRDGRARVRLQGVDAPETVKEDSPIQPWGPEASDFTKAFIRQAGGKVRIEVDGEGRDQYGRYLGFVWSGSRLLNEELLRAGLARAKLAYDYSQSKKDRLRRAQREAQRASRGIWSSR